MGRCRRCGCTEFECGFLQYCVNFVEKAVDMGAVAFGKVNGHNPQPNQNVAFRKCTCGHQRNYHF